ARDEFEKINPLIEKISDEKEQEITNEMYETMMSRYDAYDNVYDSYMESINVTEDLYELLKDEDFKEDEVYDVISNVNDLYEDVVNEFYVFIIVIQSFI